MYAGEVSIFWFGHFPPDNEMCIALYEQFVNVFESCGTLYNGKTLREFLADGLHLSAQDVKRSEGPITLAEITKVLGDCPRQNSPGHDGLPHEFYSCMSNIWHLLASVYSFFKRMG